MLALQVFLLHPKVGNITINEINRALQNVIYFEYKLADGGRDELGDVDGFYYKI